nr:MAG TPA: hypothetical protein [Caudoviricetes sp.]
MKSSIKSKVVSNAGLRLFLSFKHDSKSFWYALSSLKIKL